MSWSDTGGSPVWMRPEGASKPQLVPRRRQNDRPLGALFSVDAFLLFDPFRGPFQDLEFLFELANPMSCCSKFSLFLVAIARPASVIYVILTQPGMKCDLVDIEISGSLLELSTFAD
jgi:hypothetical protein